MKSHIKENIAKSTLQSLITLEPIDEDTSVAHLSYLGLCAVESQLCEGLIIEKWLYNNKSHIWTASISTLGGVHFTQTGKDMKEVIDHANNYFKNI